MEASAPRTAAGPAAGIGLPSSWELLWVSPSDPDPPAALLLTRLSGQPARTSFSMALLQGTLPVPAGGTGPVRIALGTFPAFDDLWCLYMLAARAEGRPVSAEWEDLSRYAENVRQGIWSDRVPVEQSLQAIYLAIAQQHLLRPQPRRESFVREAFLLFDSVTQQLRAGKRLLDDPLAAGNPVFERQVALLSADQSLYAEDLKRSERFWAEVPQAGTSTGASRTVPLLFLARPSATQFKLWARRDAAAPGNHGYPLLLVESADGGFVLSADPTSKLRVGWLAPLLPGGTGKRWYAGEAHDGTLISSPPGARLSSREVLRALRTPLRLKTVRKTWFTSRRMRKVLGAAAAFLASIVAVESRDVIVKWIDRTFRGSKASASVSQVTGSVSGGTGSAAAGSTDGGRPPHGP
ncbi:MAG TPA: hypothetical protein VLT82_10540 [Myxococcaceae bacterium]|nr:hypothetical protein [Myxococcaceae bacterium]